VAGSGVPRRFASRVSRPPAAQDRDAAGPWRTQPAGHGGSAPRPQRPGAVPGLAPQLRGAGRRRPDALQAWFDSGGRAASGPDKFFLDATW